MGFVCPRTPLPDRTACGSGDSNPSTLNIRPTGQLSFKLIERRSSEWAKIGRGIRRRGLGMATCTPRATEHLPNSLGGLRLPLGLCVHAAGQRGLPPLPPAPYVLLSPYYAVEARRRTVGTGKPGPLPASPGVGRALAPGCPPLRAVPRRPFHGPPGVSSLRYRRSCLSVPFFCAEKRAVQTPGRARNPWPAQRATVPISALMILPQVHLRKPCYDFYFL